VAARGKNKNRRKNKKTTTNFESPWSNVIFGCGCRLFAQQLEEEDIVCVVTVPQDGECHFKWWLTFRFGGWKVAFRKKADSKQRKEGNTERTINSL